MRTMNKQTLNAGTLPGSRRTFLTQVGIVAAGSLITGARGAPLAAATAGRIRAPAGSAKQRPDLLDANSANGLEILQLTTDPDLPSSHVYMEAQIFTPDSKR